MLKLNLLPPTQKQELEWERNRRFTIFVSGVVFIFLAIFAVLLFSTKLFIDIQLEPLEKGLASEKEQTETKKVEELRGKLEDLNKKINNLAAIQEAQESWLPILEEIAKLPPSGVTFYSLSLEKKNIQLIKEVKITGHADIRDQVLALKENIEKNPNFTNLVFPSSNIIKPEDIDFTLSFTIQ